MDTTELGNRVGKFVSVWGMNIIAALAIFFIGKWVAGVLSRTLERALKKSNLDETLTRFLKSLSYIVLMVVVVIAAVGKLGVPTTSFLTILGAAGLAIGLALQSSLSNFSAGVMLIFFRPFRVGDFVEAAGIMGTVSEVQIFATVLMTPDNRRQIIPNAQIYGDAITNFSAVDKRRVDMVMGIGYDDDIKKARDIMVKLVDGHEKVLKDPAPVVAVDELGDNSVNFVVRPWCKPGDYWAVKWELIEQIKAEFDKEGISIPYPQRDLHIKGWPTGTPPAGLPRPTARV